MSAPVPGLALRTPGELIAAIPTLMGFRPTESLIVIIYTAHAPCRVLGGVLRVDFPDPAQADAWVDQLCVVVANQQATGVGLVVVGGSTLVGTPGHAAEPIGHDPHRLVDDLPGRDLLDAVEAGLARMGTEVVDAFWAASVDSGSWRCYRDPKRGGAIPDPAAVPLVAALAVAGAVTYGSREELAAVLAPDPAEVLARRAELIAALAAVDSDAEVRFLVELVSHAHIGAVNDPRCGDLVLDDATIARLAHALAESRVRDAALVLCVGPLAATAERLWTMLVRATPGVLVAHPASLLGLSALLRGDGALTGIALELACRHDPHHPLAGLLLQALQVGLHPLQLRRALETAGARSIDPNTDTPSVHTGQFGAQAGPAEGS